MAERPIPPPEFSSDSPPPIDADYRQKVSIDYLVLTQLDRTNKAAVDGDSSKFNNSVDILLSMLPKENQKRIEQMRDEFTSTTPSYSYRYAFGRPMGTPENPIYRNLPSDWNYEEGPPVLVSPIPTETTEVDYQKLYKYLLAELQDIGVTWRAEPRDKIGKRIKVNQTPLLKENARIFRLIPTRISTHSSDELLIPEILKAKPGHVDLPPLPTVEEIVETQEEDVEVDDDEEIPPDIEDIEPEETEETTPEPEPQIIEEPVVKAPPEKIIPVEKESRNVVRRDEVEEVEPMDNMEANDKVSRMLRGIRRN